MAYITSRDALKEYCLRRLGAPVIEINVDDEQVEDRIQDAIDYWHEYHFDGVERVYLKAEIIASTLTLQSAVTGLFQDQEKITGATSGATAKIWKVESTTQFKLKGTKGAFLNNELVTGSSSGYSALTATSNAFVIGNWDLGYLQVADNVLGINRILTFGGGTSGTNPRNIFDVVYQFRLTDLYDLLSTDLIYYAQVKQHLTMLDHLLPGDRTIRFNRKSSKLFIDMNWTEMLTPGNFIVAEALRILDPNDFRKVYDDIFLKKYATALVKRQWGANLIKYSGIQLPGGVTLNGDKIFEEATTEIEKLEREMQLRYEEPALGIVG